MESRSAKNYEEEDEVLNLLLDLSVSDNRFSGAISIDALYTCLNGGRRRDLSENSHSGVAINEFCDHEGSLPPRENLVHATSRAKWMSTLSQIGHSIEDLSSFDLHYAASQVLLRTEDANAALRINESFPALTIVCILLCCKALEKSTEGSIQKLPKRWQSLNWETLQLFQIHFMKHRLDESQLINTWVSLWIRFVLPASVQLQRILSRFTISSALTEPNNPEMFESNLVTTLQLHDTAFLSSIVSTATDCASCLCCGQMKDMTKTQCALSSLIQSLWDPLEGCFDQVLWYHPWRSKFSSMNIFSATSVLKFQSKFSSLQTAMFYWTTQKFEEEKTGEDYEDMLDQFARTEWNRLGLAALAAVAFQAPTVWSFMYCWRLWFPFVAVLLNAEAEYDSHNPRVNDNDETDLSSMSNKCYLVCCLPGCSLLERLLILVPPSSLNFPRTLSVAYDAAKAAPINPIGTLQLLSNRLLTCSTNYESHVTPHHLQLPTVSTYYLLMRNLISKYHFMDQTRIVRTLLRDCPHPVLYPKLVDLWRPFVSWTDSSSVSLIWQFCDEKLKCLEMHSVSASSNGNAQLINVEELVESAELYSSCLNLMYLWIRVKKSLPEVADIVSRVKYLQTIFHEVLLRRASVAAAIPVDQYYRLYVIESVLDSMVAAMNEGYIENHIQTLSDCC